METTPETNFQENALLYRLQSGEQAAFNRIISHFGGNMNMIAFVILQHPSFANRVVRDLFLKLQEEKYKDALVPLRSYLYREVITASECFIETILERYVEMNQHEQENSYNEETY